MKQILITIASLGVQIISNQQWINGQKIVDMDDQHVYNSMLWAKRQANLETEVGITMKVNGFTYTEWVEILKAEVQRRKTLENTKILAKIEALKKALND